MVPLVNLFFFSSCFHPFSFLFFSLSPDTQALQCMLISLQAELDIQRYLMKIESSQRVSTFIFSASSRILPPAFLLNRVWHSNPCGPLCSGPVLCLACPGCWFKPLKPKACSILKCAFKIVGVIIEMNTNCMPALKYFVYFPHVELWISSNATAGQRSGRNHLESGLSNRRLHPQQLLRAAPSWERSRNLHHSESRSSRTFPLLSSGIFNLGSSSCYWHTF